MPRHHHHSKDDPTDYIGHDHNADYDGHLWPHGYNYGPACTWPFDFSGNHPATDDPLNPTLPDTTIDEHHHHNPHNNLIFASDPSYCDHPTTLHHHHGEDGSLLAHNHDRGEGHHDDIGGGVDSHYHQPDFYFTYGFAIHSHDQSAAYTRLDPLGPGRDRVDPLAHSS